MQVKDLGNIYSSGGDFTTKAALLQSCYRVDRTEPQGKTTVAVFAGFDSAGKRIYNKTAKEYGHIVSGGENKNKNFYFEETFKYAHERIRNKKPEETIKADRLFNNLLSSMPLAFNLFHPLMMLLKSDPNNVNQIVSALFPDYQVMEVEKIDIEFIPLPVSSYTEDKSAMDAVIFFTDNHNNRNIISIEVKYTDSLGTNKAKENSLKVETAIASGLFTAEGIESVKQGCTQIYRNFLLTEKYRMVHHLANSYSIILAPKKHPTTLNEINSLKKQFNESCPESKLKKYDLEDFVKTISENVTEKYRPWIDWFTNRYLNFDGVEELFIEVKQR
jgi:hypothetical protein